MTQTNPGANPSPAANVLGNVATRIQRREEFLAQQQAQQQQQQQAVQMQLMTQQIQAQQAAIAREERRKKFEFEKANANAKLMAEYGTSIDYQPGKDGRPGTFSINKTGEGLKEQEAAQKKQEKQRELKARADLVREYGGDLWQTNPRKAAALAMSNIPTEKLPELARGVGGKEQEKQGKIQSRKQAIASSVAGMWKEFGDPMLVDPELQRDVGAALQAMAENPDISYSTILRYANQRKEEWAVGWAKQVRSNPKAYTPEQRQQAENYIEAFSGGGQMDEMAKMYAEQDMAEEQKEWAREQANRFYRDFEKLDISQAITAVYALVKSGELDLTEVTTMLDNMIQVFEEDEEYEKCHVCKQIKIGVNAKV